MLTLIDEYTRKCLAIEVGRKLKSTDVFEVLAEQFMKRGLPKFIRSDNGPEFIAHQLRSWLKRLGVGTLFILSMLLSGLPLGNGYNESFNGKLRDEFLRGELFYTLREAQVLIEGWRRLYNEFRPHSSLGYRPPAPVAILPRGQRRPALPIPGGSV